MATARSSQAHQKRVKQIAEEAAEKIAAESPLEEEVIVVVEELPPGESARTQRGRTRRTDEAENTLVGMVAQSQKLVADGMSRWIEMSTAPFAARSEAMEPFGALFDARRLTEETFRLAEELVASQKEFVLKVVEAVAPAKAA